MRFAIVSVLTATLAVATVAPALAQPGGQVASRAYMVEPFTPPTPVTIQGQGVRLRAEPFTGDTQVLSSGSTGLSLTVVGIARQPDWNWYQVVLRNGQKAFIRSDLTSAPMRGGAPPVSAPAVQPVQPPPQIAYTPPPQPQPVYPQPAPSVPTTTPASPGGAISLTPGASAPQLGPAPVTSPPADSGLISISPTAPTPRFSDPVATPVPSGPAASGSISQTIRAQLDAKRCWTDSANMMDAQRLRATFAVQLAPNGRFASEPRLVDPSPEPANDPAMMVFIAKARAALRTCNAMGFDVPADYFSSGQGEVRLEFSAR